MNTIMAKLSSYNLFNYLLPGIIFVVILGNITPYSFIQEDIIVGAFIYYFIGLVISRFGSLVVEPIIKKVLCIKFAEYKDFVHASKKDSKIDIFSEVNNMYRTFSSMFVLLLLIKIYQIFSLDILWLNSNKLYILLTVLLIMFLCSYKKQTSYITKRIKANNL